MTESTEAKPARKGVRLSPDEAWAFVEGSHTGIFTTLRRDGVPIALPVWFVVLDRRIYVSTPGGSKKVVRVKNDARSSFLVESGEPWAELKAVHLTGRATVAEVDDATRARVAEASEEKYRAFRTVRTEMPSATRQHYSQQGAVIAFDADERIVSWDNARLFS